MAEGYRPVVRDQEFLLPPNMIDWLPDDHLVWFVLDTVAALDTAPLHVRAARRRDGGARRSAAGRAGYDPQMLLGLLLYAYCCGQRSSRQIERLCTTDVAFRVACAGDTPDHTVLARFRQAYEEVFADLFAQVLRLCRQEGMARLGTVAIDGTKIAANASRQANREREWLAVEAERLDQAGTDQAGADQAGADQVGGEQSGVGRERVLAEQVLNEAAQLDAAEDACFGHEARGDERPPGWGGRAGRRARIRAAAERIAAADAAREQQGAQNLTRIVERETGALERAEQALATATATQQDKIDAWEQAWERAIDTGGLVPRGCGPRPVEQVSPVRRARERIERARHRIAHPETAPRRGSTKNPDRRGRRDRDQPARANTTDPDSSLMPSTSGWVQSYNAQLAITADQIILGTEVGANPADVTYYDSMVKRVLATAAALEADHEVGTLLFDAGYASEHTLSQGHTNPHTSNRSTSDHSTDNTDNTGDTGYHQLIALGKTRSVLRAARDRPATGPPAVDASPAEAMDHRLRTPEGAQLYTRRGATVEPGIGNLKKLLDRFARRGISAVRTELELAATAFNLRKLHQTAAT